MDELIENQLYSYPWTPDPPDFRDLSLQSEEAIALVQFMEQCRTNEPAIDLREWIPSIQEPMAGISVAVNAACTLIEFFRQLYEANNATLSRSFVHHSSSLLFHQLDGVGTSIRSALKCLKMLGAPPASLVRSLELRGDRAESSPICYQFSRDFLDIQYFRIDSQTTIESVNTVKSLLQSGVPCVFGMSLPSSFGSDSRIELRSEYDSVIGCTAGVFAGYDDDYRISTSGAFCFRSMFPASWGENGFGWISYDMLHQGMICDIWTVMHPKWLRKMAEDKGFRFVENRNSSLPDFTNDAKLPPPREFPGRNRLH